MRAKGSAALEKLVRMVGLEKVKEQLLALRETSAEYRAPKANFSAIFSGPKGTGKTEVAKIYGELLRELGVLEGTGNFEQTSGGELARGGVPKLETVLKKMNTYGRSKKRFPPLKK